MKLNIGKEHLIEGLQAVQNIATSRTTLPILSNVLLQADGSGFLTLTATDLDVSVSCTVRANIEGPGEVTLPGKRLFGITRELSMADISMEVNEKNVCNLQSGSSYYKINGLPAVEYPALPTFDFTNGLVLPQEKVRSMLRRTSYAVSTDETRYVLNGIFMKFEDRLLTMVATDGRRLAMVDTEVDNIPEGGLEWVIPTKAINELSRLLEGKGMLEIQATGNQVAFRMAGDENQPRIVFISKLVEGSYPNYRQVIPNDSKQRVTIVREELLHALRRAELMTSEKVNSVKFCFGDNNLSIHATDPEVGEARESLAINYSGEEVTVAFNPVYLMDPLKALDQDEVYFEFSDQLSPGVLKVNEPFTYVIMPMRSEQRQG